MLDTAGPELLVVNKGDHPIPLEADSFVVLTPDQEKEATSSLLPINFSGLAKVIVLYIHHIWLLFCSNLKKLLGFVGSKAR